MNKAEYKQHVVIGIPVLLIGGTERQTLTLVSVLLSGGYKVTVCCYYEYDLSMVSQMKAIGSEVILMGLRRSDGLWHLYKKLKLLLKELTPDVIHVQYVAPGFIPIIASRLARIKTIFATVHQPGRVYGWKEKSLLRIAAKLCTSFFCNSQSVEKSWFGDSEVFDPVRINPKRKHFTIYNAVDVNYIEQVISKVDTEELRNKHGINNKPVIGVVGRLRWEKGQDILLDAMPEVIKAIPDVVLLVVGDGPDREKLQGKATKLGIEKNIIWTGQIDHEEVIKLYTIMDVVAVPSKFEGFGLSAAESMAARVPVVATRVDGLTEVIENDVTSVLVSTGDSATLASALTGLLSDREKAREMGQKGQERVRELFSMVKFQKSILAAYEVFAVRKS